MTILTGNAGFSALQLNMLRNAFNQSGGDAFLGANQTFTANNTFAGGTTQTNILNVGASGTLGTFNVYQGTASKGSLALVAVANTGNTVTTISNAAMGQASVISIPDPGAATDTFALLGTSNVFSGTSNQINTLNIGASGTVGSLSLFSTTASKGKWLVSPVDNTGNTTMTITNAAQAGAYTYTIPSAGASASFMMTQGAQTVVGNNAFNGATTIGATGSLGFVAGAILIGNPVPGTLSSNAVTINNMSGVITTGSLNTAGGANYAMTLTNSQILTTSSILVTWAGGTNSTANFSIKAAVGNGSATITLYNNTAATAFNGTVILNFLVTQ